jgi:hypothetical protein
VAIERQEKLKKMKMRSVSLYPARAMLSEFAGNSPLMVRATFFFFGTSETVVSRRDHPSVG